MMSSTVDELLAERDELRKKLAASQLEVTSLTGRLDKIRQLRPAFGDWGKYAFDEGWYDEVTMRGVLAQFDAMTGGS